MESIIGQKVDVKIHGPLSTPEWGDTAEVVPILNEVQGLTSEGHQIGTTALFDRVIRCQ